MLDTSTGVQSQNEELVFTESQLDIVTRDPATFALTFLITNRNEWLLKDLYERVPSQLHDLLDTLLSHFNKTGVIELSDAKSRTKKTTFTLLDNERVSNFLPKVFELISRNLLEKPLAEFKRDREGIRYFVMPDSPDVALEAEALYKEFIAKMDALRIKATAALEASDTHRVVGVMSYKMELEDFV